MSSEVSREAIDAALEQVVDPCSIATGVPISIREMGLIQSIEIDGSDVTVVICLTSPICMQVTNIIALAEERLLDLAGVTSATCKVDPIAEWEPEMMSTGARNRLRRRRDLRKLEPDARKTGVGTRSLEGAR